jgi:hypothetical protein
MIVPGMPDVDMAHYTSTHIDQSSLAIKGGGSSTNRISSRQFSRRVNHSLQPAAAKPEEQRKVPRFISSDKEHLYLEIQQLKASINNLQAENTKLRTQSSSLEVPRTEERRKKFTSCNP